MCCGIDENVSEACFKGGVKLFALQDYRELYCPLQNQSELRENFHQKQEGS
jgi:hypothetical protein